LWGGKCLRYDQVGTRGNETGRRASDEAEGSRRGSRQARRRRRWLNARARCASNVRSAQAAKSIAGFQLAPPAKADAAPAPIRSLQNGSTAASGDSGVATPVAVDFLEWARTTSAAKQGGAMRKRLEGLFGARPTDKSTN
jgi:hypothetical protein